MAARFLPALLWALLLSLTGIPFADAQPINRTDESGRKQGKWVQKHPNGRLRYEGQFEDGRPTGLFKYYFDSGKLKATNNHMADGSVASHHYHPSGKIKAKGIYRNEKKDSLWQYFNDREVLMLEETYRQDILHGAKRTYFDNGKLGEEMHYRDSVRHGPWVKFFVNGQKWTEGNYVNGSLDGAFKIWNDDGKPRLQGNYSMGLRNGTWLNFGLNGVLRTQDVYDRGVLKRQKPENGEFEEYYDSGIPKSLYTFKKGKRNGDFKEWYDKGEWVVERKPGTMGGPDEEEEKLVGTQLRVQGYYHDDVLNGKVTYYRMDGSTEKVEVYENGELKSTIDWEKDKK